MNTYLQSLGWWNLIGSLLMLGMFSESFGKKMMNEWTKIFREDFKLDYWIKFWMAWAIGLNIFYGLANILGGYWPFYELKVFLVYSDIFAYLSFFFLAVWGWKSGRCAEGVYAAFVIFLFWIGWGIVSLL